MNEKIMGLLGRKLGHSHSPYLHQRLGGYDYRLIELEPPDLAAFLRRPDIGGLNVTIPYKIDVLPYCDVLSPEVEEIGCANTLVRRPDGRLYAYNTDRYGLERMARRAGIGLAGKKVLILGSGGASLTAQVVARGQGAKSVTVISRRGPDHYGNLSRHRDGEIIVNTTPVGMFPENGAAPVSLADFPACTGVLDVIYNPRRTALILDAEARGIPCADGLYMLAAQAKAACELFTGAAISDARLEEVYGALSRDTQNIVLVGMPGSGKTTVGAALAAITGRETADLDAMIEQTAGQSIPDIFRDGGEAAFRALERAAAAEAGRLGGKIIATGGGVVLDGDNYPALRQNGRIYHLTRDLSLLGTEARPLSKDADTLRRMAEVRLPLYRRFADREIENSADPEAAAQAIWRDFCEHSGD